MPGACVSRARLHAAEGAPMPTKHTSELLSARAATMVIISLGVHVDEADMVAAALALLVEHAHALRRRDGCREPYLRAPADLRFARHDDGVERGMNRVGMGSLHSQASEP